MRWTPGIPKTLRSGMSKRSTLARTVALAVVFDSCSTATVMAQSRDEGHARAPQCELLCAPTVTLMPALLHIHVRGGPQVRNVNDGTVHRLPSVSAMEIIVAAASKTAVPRLSLFGSVQWLPNALETRNPFTLYSADELGSHIRANAPTVTIGASVALLEAKQTHGVFDAGVNVGDLFSQAARPGDRSAYTHKLDLDLVAHWNAFNWTPTATYLHHVQVFGILDYVATGLPKAGDEVPMGRVFVSDARPLAAVIGLSFPIAGGSDQ